MSDPPELYRQIALELRRLADQSPLPDIQLDLVSLAEHFERLAAHLEAQNRLSEADRRTRH